MRSNQSIIKEINPEHSLEGLMLKLKIQNYGHLIWRGNLLEKTLILGKIESRRRGRQRVRWLDGITDSMDRSWSKLWEIVEEHYPWRTWKSGMLQSMGATKRQTQLSNWTTTTNKGLKKLKKGLSWKCRVGKLPEARYRIRASLLWSSSPIMHPITCTVTIGLAKKFIWVFPQDDMENPKWIFCPTQHGSLTVSPCADWGLENYS